MVLSDSLDMVGVEIKAFWVQTRRSNGDILQTKVTNIINAWKSGKFMDLICRPWSVNTYALSLVQVSHSGFTYVFWTSPTYPARSRVGCFKSSLKTLKR